MIERFSTLDSPRLAALVRAKRGAATLRQAAAETGISASTLSRLERGQWSTMSLETFLRVCDWLQVATAHLIVTGVETEAEPNLSDLAIIAARLRATTELPPAMAQALADLVHAARREAYPARHERANNDHS